MKNKNRLYNISEISTYILPLLRCALSGESVNLPKGVDWQMVKSVASLQGVSAVVLDGVANAALVSSLPMAVKMQWIGEVANQESMYEHSFRIACELSELWGQQEIEAVVLKGRSISQYYPKPEHRYSCDLDVYIAGDNWQKACDILEAKGVKLVREVYKEVEFTYDGLYVECHRFITPYRGNDTLKCFEHYLKELLSSMPIEYFEGTRLICPPLLFTVMLSIEHALGDLLHGKLSLKHVVDWVVLRGQNFDRVIVEEKCKELGFDRFLRLIDALADVVEGKRDVDSLSLEHKEVFDSFFVLHPESKCVSSTDNSWFARRVGLFFEIIHNRNLFKRYGYCSMEKFLVNTVWAHFFDTKFK